LKLNAVDEEINSSGINNRIWEILRSTTAQLASRIDLALIRGAFVLACLLGMLPLPEVTSQSIGRSVYFGFFLLSFVMAIFLSGRLAGDSVGDRRSGFLALICLSGLTSGQWLLLRLIQIWIGFISVWIVRIPFLLFLPALGGVDWEFLAYYEAILLLTFLVFSSFGLLIAQFCETRRDLIPATVALAFFLELLFTGPAIFSNVIWLLDSKLIGSGWMSLFSTLSMWSVTMRLSAMSAPVNELPSLWPTVIVFGLLAAYLLSKIRYVAFRNLGTSGPASSPSSKSKVKSNGKRYERCWDDAFAWQAFAFHSSGKAGVSLKIAFYLMALTVLGMGLMTNYGELVIVLSLLGAALGLMMASDRPGNSFQREVKENTLTALLLTPHHYVDMYDGWRRGTVKFMWPDVAYCILVLGLIAIRFPIVSLIGFSVFCAVMVSGPFMMLSPLVPYTFRGIATGILLIAEVVVLIIIAAIAAGTIHLIAFPLVLFPAWWGTNIWLRAKMIPYWMELKAKTVIQNEASQV